MPTGKPVYRCRSLSPHRCVAPISLASSSSSTTPPLHESIHTPHSPTFLIFFHLSMSKPLTLPTATVSSLVHATTRRRLLSHKIAGPFSRLRRWTTPWYISEDDHPNRPRHPAGQGILRFHGPHSLALRFSLLFPRFLPAFISRHTPPRHLAGVFANPSTRSTGLLQ